MDTVIQNVANELLAITNTQILAKGDVFNNLDQTQIKIGKNPAFTQAANSIILNATGANLSNTIENSCVIKPIRQSTQLENMMLNYNTTTGEVSTVPLNTIVISNDQFRLFHVDPSLQGKFIIGAPNLFLVFAKMTITLDSSDEFHSTIHCNRKSPNNTGADLMTFTHTNSLTNVSNYTGSIKTTSTGVTYNTTSDYRLKNVIGDITDASARVLSLKPIRFRWKSSGQEVDGFLAHEVQEIVPEAVHGTKDAVDDKGNPLYQGMDNSKLVPLLVASLQDALKRIEMLEAQINNLIQV